MALCTLALLAQGYAEDKVYQINEAKIVETVQGFIAKDHKLEKEALAGLKLRYLKYGETIDEHADGYGWPVLEVHLWDTNEKDIRRNGTVYRVNYEYKLSVKEFPKVLKKHKGVAREWKQIDPIKLRKGSDDKLVSFELEKIVEACYTWKYGESKQLPVKKRDLPAYFTYEVNASGLGKRREFSVYFVKLDEAVLKPYRDKFTLGVKGFKISVNPESVESTILAGYRWSVYFPEAKKAHYEALVEKAKAVAAALPKETK